MTVQLCAVCQCPIAGYVARDGGEPVHPGCHSQVPEKWISRDASRDGHTPVYHTDLDCHAAPEECRPVTEDDERRGVRECSYCQGVACRPTERFDEEVRLP